VLRLALALFAVQAGFHGFTASLPLALAEAGVPDPEIGIIVGLAAVVQIPAAIVAGALVDRFGGARLLVLGAIAYLVAAAVLLSPGVEAGGDPTGFLVARIAQGIGIATALPSALSLVPRLVGEDRRGFGLAFVGSAHNLTLVVLPPLSLAILSQGSLDAVVVAVVGLVAVGLAVTLTLPRALWPRAGHLDRGVGDHASTHRRLGFAFRSSWAGPLAIVLLYVVHWGVVTAYLPQRAHAAGADVGLFFAADGLAVLAFRVPSGWLADRVPLRWLMLAGLALTFAAIALLLAAPTTPLLVVAGLLTGSGAGLVITPVLVELSRRSDDRDRGSAFALFSASLAAALAIGSIAVAPVVASAGFEAAIGAALVGLAGAGVLAVRERSVRTPQRAVGPMTTPP
jgi:MFS family permease